MNRVAEERPLAKDHPERARFGQDTHVAGVSSDIEHRDVAGPGRRRIDDAAGAGVDTVGPDQEVSHGLGTVLEPRRYAAPSGVVSASTSRLPYSMGEPRLTAS